ncbi:hypothetical protein [Enterococcus faecium]|uniref:hypothetical protein n=1 Tax=Enterococcus faecium TaxID=1352 RepID=UPI0030C7BEAE
MIKRELTAIGCFFICISAFLYAAKHLTAAIMTAYINSPDVNYFGGGYQTVGFGITFWIAISFIVGLFFLIGGIYPIFLKRVPDKNIAVQQEKIEKQV